MAATISTRALGGNDNFDRIAIRVDGNAYKDANGVGKWGIIEVVLTKRRRLRVRPGFDADLLLELVRLLEDASC